MIFPSHNAFRRALLPQEGVVAIFVRRFLTSLTKVLPVNSAMADYEDQISDQEKVKKYLEQRPVVAWYCFLMKRL